MNRRFLRDVAHRAGYNVHSRSSHGAPAWDWGPKHPMLANHFRSEDAAYRDLEDHMRRTLHEADRLIRIARSLIEKAERAPGKELSILDKLKRHANCRPGWCATAHVSYCPRQVLE